jgi:hypothetical protein
MVNRRNDNQIKQRYCVTRRQHIIECHGIFVRSHGRDTGRSFTAPAIRLFVQR